MYENVRSRRVQDSSLINPPPLPDKQYRARLRIAAKTYRAEKGKGWAWLIKNEIHQCLTEAEKSHASCAALLDVELLRARIGRWCDTKRTDAQGAIRLDEAGEPMGGDTSDPRLVLLMERFLSIYGNGADQLVLPTDRFVEQGRMMASFFSQPSIKHGEMGWKAATSLQEKKQGKKLGPGKYRLFLGALLDAQPDYEYLSIIDIGEPLFYKAVLFFYKGRGENLFLERMTGFLFKKTRYPLLVMRNPWAYIKIASAITLDVKEIKKNDGYVTTLMPDPVITSNRDYYYSISWALDDVYPLEDGDDEIARMLDYFLHENLGDT